MLSFHFVITFYISFFLIYVLLSSFLRVSFQCVSVISSSSLSLSFFSLFLSFFFLTFFLSFFLFSSFLSFSFFLLYYFHCIVFKPSIFILVFVTKFLLMHTFVILLASPIQCIRHDPTPTHPPSIWRLSKVQTKKEVFLAQKAKRRKNIRYRTFQILRHPVYTSLVVYHVKVKLDFCILDKRLIFEFVSINIVFSCFKS